MSVIVAVAAWCSDILLTLSTRWRPFAPCTDTSRPGAPHRHGTRGDFEELSAAHQPAQAQPADRGRQGGGGEGRGRQLHATRAEGEREGPDEQEKLGEGDEAGWGEQQGLSAAQRRDRNA